jgi:protein gp37
MGEFSKIEWTTHTFNPWIGCQKVSPGCDNCYAEALMDNRLGRVQWGPHGERKRTSEANWRKPRQWAKAANGERQRVFCASLADWLDNKVPEQWREDLAVLIDDTPQLDWLLLTKRIENFNKLAPWHHDDVPPNVWLGVTIENQDAANKRIPILCKIQARVRFLSCEPMLGEIDLERGGFTFLRQIKSPQGCIYEPVHWVICGGESGPHRRPMDLAWARKLRDDCRASGVPFFMKQIDKVRSIPDDLMVRQFPEATP